MTDIGAPPVVSKQKLWLQKYSFQSFFRICGKFFLDQSATGTLVRIDEFAQRGLWLRSEHDVDMIDIVVPFFDCYCVVWSNIFKYVFQAVRNIIINYFPSVFYY